MHVLILGAAGMIGRKLGENSLKAVGSGRTRSRL